MKKITFYFYLFITLVAWSYIGAQTVYAHVETSTPTFEATVVQVGDNVIRVEDTYGERFAIEQIVDTALRRQFHEGDKVVVQHVPLADGGDQYLIIDVVRGPWLYILILLFGVIVIAVSGKRGLKSLITLCVTLAMIIGVIIPLILRGWNPVLVSIVGGSIAMAFAIYFVYGFSKKSHAVFISTAGGLVLAGILSWFFVRVTSLTGFIDEEATYLVAMGHTSIDMRGLLLAAILIGMLGVIDDVVIGQVSVVEELRRANPSYSSWELYRAAMRVGKDHMSSMVNTLALAYTGAAFPLMILFTLREPPFDTMRSILNNEIVATELVRTLVGSIALLCSAPFSTFVAIWWERHSK